MKQKYIVRVEDGYDSSSGLPKLKEIKTFKHAPEAIEFITAPKNIGMYGTLYLERVDADGNRYGFNGLTRSWIQQTEES